MRQAGGEIQVHAERQGLQPIDAPVAAWIADTGICDGLLTIFCRHSSASLLIQENASPAARVDLERWIATLAPEDEAAYAHDEEGPDDMPAHLRSAITATQLSIPLAGGRLVLGTWQGIYLFEHRRRPPTRRIALHLIGE